MIKTRSLWLLAGSFLILSGSEAAAQSLREAVQAALATHPTVEAAQAAVQSANEARGEARSDYFPEASMSVGGGRMYGNNSTSRGLTVSRGAAYSWLWEGSASLSQNIFNGFETKNRVAAAAARENAAVLNVADARETLALRATQAYLSVARAQETLAAVKEYEQKIDDYLKRVQDMVDQGGADESEAAQARNVALMLKNNEIDMEGQLEGAIASFREVVGSAPQGMLRRPAVPKQIVEAGADAAFTMAKDNHPALKSILQEMEAAQFDVKAEKGTLLPDLDGELSYTKRDQKEEIGGESEDRRAMLRASWDVSLGGGDFARVRKAKADALQNEARLKEKEREIERDIRLAFAELNTAKKQYDLAAQREKVTTELLDAYNIQFEGAKVRLLQLMQSENQVFGTHLDKLNADYRVLAAEYAVLASAGKLQDVITTAVEMPETALAPAPETEIKSLPAPEGVEVPEKKEEAVKPETSSPDSGIAKTLTQDLTGGAKDKTAMQTVKQPVFPVEMIADTTPPSLKEDVVVDDPIVPAAAEPAKAVEPVLDSVTEKTENVSADDASGEHVWVRVRPRRSDRRADQDMTDSERMLPVFEQE